MTTPIDLDGYFDRIGWNGGTSPTMETLVGLLQCHMRSIPFENLDVLLGRTVCLDLKALQAKLVRARRGGYCFEHATLFGAVIEQLGFETRRHSARVVLFVPRNQAPRAHMFLTVSFPDGRFVLDPGFGGPASTSPILLEEAESSPHAEPTHAIMREGAYWVLRAEKDGKHVPAWVSTLEEDTSSDFEMANHFTATHPASPFRNRLMMSLFIKDGRVTLMNQDFTVRNGDIASCGKLESRQALQAFICDHFGFEFPDVGQLRLPFIPEWN